MLTIRNEVVAATDNDEPATKPEMTERQKLEAELASLRVPEKLDELREIREDIAFEKAKKAAKANERIGRVRLEPGQVIFRQMTRSQFERAERADQVPPGKPPMTEAQAAEAKRIVNEQIFRECMKSPDWDTFQSWLDLYPLALTTYGVALNEHNSAYRRDREVK